MMRSVKNIYGDELRALDGAIGRIKDFYFSDKNWIIRFVVVNTGSWLEGRRVLLSPQAFSNFDRDGFSCDVNLTRKQIEDSPALASHKPVSRQFQEEYYRYYGWPDYWNGDGLWGMGPVPPLKATTGASHVAPSTTTLPDGDLRSTRALEGYQVQTLEGPVGSIVDFIMDDRTWAIRDLWVESSLWHLHKRVLLSSKKIDRVSYSDSKIFTQVTREALLKSPEYPVPLGGFDDSTL